MEKELRQFCAAHFQETNRNEQPPCHTREISIQKTFFLFRKTTTETSKHENLCTSSAKKCEQFCNASNWRKRKQSYNGKRLMRLELNDWLDWSMYVPVFLVKLFVVWHSYWILCPFGANEFIDESAVKCFMKPVSITRRMLADATLARTHIV